MIYKYWVTYDENGEVEGLYKDKVKDAVECIVKIVPINRLDSKVQEVTDEYDKFLKELIEMSSDTKKFSTEIQKLTRGLRRIK